MTEERIKVKDLAAELGLTSKDVLAAAKTIGVLSAKVAQSSLLETDVSRLRAHFTQPADADKAQVIVRRRKKSDGVESKKAEKESEPQQAAAPEENGAEAPSAPARKEVSAEKAEPVESKPEEKLEEVSHSPSADEEPVVAVVEKAKKAADKPAAARIIKRGGEEQEAVAPVETVSEKEAEAVAPVEIAAEPVAEETVKVEEKTASVVEKEVEAAPEEKKDNSAKPAGARVIRPAAFSAEPERTADGQAVSSAPVMGAKTESEDENDSPSQVRVISRPDPAPRAQQQERPQNARPGQRPRPDGGRPSGTGAPRSDAGAPSMPGGFMPPAAPSADGESRKRRQKGRRTVDFSASRDRGGDDDQGWARNSRRGKKSRQRDAAPMGGTQPVKAVKRKIKVEEFIRVSDLAHQMQLKSGEIIKVLFNLGVMATINQSLDIDTATLVASEFGYEIEKVGFDAEDIIDSQKEADNPEDMITRPPVVTIMGHVDHGKTSLLDAIRKSSVVTGEAGGITQHIGAYHVSTPNGDIVFLDTPGHEAFTAMRARGAEVTDIVVLVVAADDGVMDQTREAINHSRAAGVPIMVAVNKIDKEAANPDRVKRELSEQGLLAEDWGGDIPFLHVSAKTGQGLEELLELLALQAEILELKANPNKPARGHIVEAKLDKGRGALGTILIQEGTLRTGDAFVCGVHSGRVRSMFNDQGKKVKEAGPSMPVEVQGFEGVPEAGEEFICLADEKTARRIAESRALKQRERELAKESKITLETFLSRRADSVDAEVLNLVVKSDVAGSLEAITDALHKLSTEKVRISVIHGGTGAISESDVLLATASNAIIIGFNVRPSVKAKELAEHEKVDIRFYDIIYKLVEEIKSAMEGMLAPLEKEVFLGSAEVRETFSVPKIGIIAGCNVVDGKILRNAQIRLLRDGVVVHNGKIGSLKRFKDDVREVAKGYECGIGLENYNDIKIGDVIEAFEIVEEAAKL